MVLSPPGLESSVVTEALDFLLARLPSGLCSAESVDRNLWILSIPGLEVPIHGTPLPCLCSEILVKMKYGFVIFFFLIFLPTESIVSTM